MAAALCAWAACGAHAEEPEQPALEPDAASDEPAVHEVLEDEEVRATQWFGVERVRASYPLLASVGVGVGYADRREAFDCTSTCELQGWLGSIEAGAGGGQLDFGPVFMIGELGDNSFFLSRRYLAYALKASLLRTWGETPKRPDHELFGGVEAEFMVVSLNLSLGVYRRIGDETSREPWLVAGGIGWGF
jgi:hypothetical protein